MITRRTALSGLVLGAIGAATMSTATAATLNNPAIFYSPHADDESLSMGLDIANHVRAGRDVVLVLATIGASSAMLDILNGRVFDDQAGVTHSPTLEGYADGTLDNTKAGNARIKEFTSAASQYRLYGGGRGQFVIDTSWKKPDSGLTDSMADDIIWYYASRYPNGSHKTMSWTDPHPDHAALGKALQRSKASTAIHDARWYVQIENLQYAQNAGVYPWEVTPDDQSVVDTLRRALRCYQAWNPAAGSYSFGYRSVKGTFDSQVSNPKGWVHA